MSHAGSLPDGLPALVEAARLSLPTSTEALRKLAFIVRKESTHTALLAAGALEALVAHVRAYVDGTVPLALELALQTLSLLTEPEQCLDALVATGAVPLLLYLVRVAPPCLGRKRAVQVLGDVSESIWTRTAIADGVRAQGGLEAFSGVATCPFDSGEADTWRELTRNCEVAPDLYAPAPPALAFHDPHSAAFPFVDMLEAHWREIQAEAKALQEELMVAWPEKNLYTTGWDVLAMFAFENKLEAPAKSCPKTTALLEQIPGLQTAVFSRLQPRAHIKPHVGYYAYSEKILRVHLGLIVPEGCKLKVNGEDREWREGEVMIFDDTFRHEAWNPSYDQERIVLMFDVKHTFENETRNPDFVATSARQKQALGENAPALVSKDLVEALSRFGAAPGTFQQRPDQYH